MRINTNIPAMQATRQLAKTTQALARALERLSSGRRINSARDDVSGLAISTGLESERRGLLRAALNVNQTFGYLATADGALATQIEIVQRMKELAIQASQGTLATSDRLNLDLELQSLSAEFDRISRQTQFNGTPLLDGTFSSTSIQVGTQKGQNISFNFSDTLPQNIFVSNTQPVGTGTFISSKTSEFNKAGDLVGIEDVYSDQTKEVIFYNSETGILTLSGEQSLSFSIGKGYELISKDDLDGSGTADLVFYNSSTGGLTSYSSADGLVYHPALATGLKFLKPADTDQDGLADLVGYNASTGDIVYLLSDNTGGFFRTVSSQNIGPFESAHFQDLNGDSIRELIVNYSDRFETFTYSHGQYSSSGVFNNQRFVIAGDFGSGQLALLAEDIVGENKTLFRPNGSFVDFIDFDALGTPGYKIGGVENIGYNQDADFWLFNESTRGFRSVDINQDAIKGCSNELFLGANENVVGFSDFDGGGFKSLVTYDSSSRMVNVYASDFSDPDTWSIVASTQLEAGFEVLEMKDISGQTTGKELVTVNRNTGEAIIYISDSIGFYENSRLSTSTHATQFMTGDILNDGKWDLIATNPDSSVYHTIRDVGTGSIDETINSKILNSLALTANSNSQYFYDMNGDGVKDFILSDTNNSSYVSVQLGRGDGTFSEAIVTDFAGSNSEIPAVFIDLNGDGILDGAAYRPDGGSINIWLGQADGSFVQHGNLGSGSGATIYWQDLNHDGRPDLTYSSGANFSSRLNLGNGNFGNLVTTNMTGVSVATQGKFNDINGDGYLDIFGFNTGSGSVGIRFGSASGTFTAGTTFSIGAAVSAMQMSSDIDGDGDIDITGTSGGAFFYRLNNGNGTFSGAATVASVAGFTWNSLNLVDFNKDGRLDLYSNTTGSGLVAIRLNNGNGTFSAPATLNFGASSGPIGFADLNGDGYKDVIKRTGARTVAIRMNNGDGTFTTAATISTNHSGGIRQEPTIMDFDGDGILDLLTTTNTEIYELRLGNGNGTFRPGIDVTGSPWFTNESGTMYFSEATDIDGDGFLDLAASNGSGFVSVSLQDTDTTEGPATLSLKTQESAQEMLSVFDGALQKLYGKRALIGATQSRLESAESSILIQGEQIAAAKSQIMDADIAEEMAEYARAQILLQVSTAVLMQANSSLQTVLSLLKF